MKFSLVLNKIRTPKANQPTVKKMFVTMLILLLGFCLGVFSKYLDYRQANLPYLLYITDTFLDLHNFLGTFSPWILAGVCISIYSFTPLRAALNVFAFFSGMVSGYYLYCYFVAGFFPKSYAMIWILFTIISPVFAYICWYAAGNGIAALIISSGILSFLINSAFAYGMFYCDIKSWLSLIILIIGICILHKSAKHTIIMVILSVFFAIIIKTLLPFSI